ncbi:MAG: hypothetical protein U9R29_10695 [Thermodesulfobacteriota bacterium]|nr:hypothetical protein [Thermodesulfobacteriota bacterium]
MLFFAIRETSVDDVLFEYGTYTLTLEALGSAAPGEDNTGYLNMEALLGTNFDFLQYDWDNADNDDDPLTGQDNPTGKSKPGEHTGSPLRLGEYSGDTLLN